MYKLSKRITAKKYIEKLEEEGYFLLGDLHYVVVNEQSLETIHLTTSFKNHNIHAKILTLILENDPSYRTDLSLALESKPQRYLTTTAFLKRYRNRQVREVIFDIKPSTKQSFEDKKDLLKYAGKQIIYSERVPVQQAGLFDIKKSVNFIKKIDNTYAAENSEEFRVTVKNYNKYFNRTSEKDIEKLIYLSKCKESDFEELFDNIITMPLSVLSEAIKPRNDREHYSLPQLSNEVTIYRKLVNYNPISTL